MKRVLLIIGLLSLPVLAQDVLFVDGFEHYEPVIADSDGDGLTDAEELILGTDPLQFDTDGDGFGDGSEQAFGTDPLDGEDFPATPPDPAATAPDPDTSVAGNVLDSTAFLYTGPDPIQTGVSPDTIELKRAALLRGRLLTRHGLPLPGASISILGHPEFGSTVSRMDGMYDLVVNGGGTLTLDYAAPGYLPAQRTLAVPWQDYVIAEDVALIPLDPIVTPVDLVAPGDMKIARGSISSDDDGQRQATVLFPAGVSAALRLADDSTVPLSELSVRATEYTVGDMGPTAMPAALPPTSGYTYAVEWSVDQALALGATSVEFDQPLPTYVENFLGFPAGTPVPTGYYDRTKAAWVPAPDGRVIDIVSETGGMADLDVDGDGVADSGTPLTELGITDAERTQMASLYDPGQSLWRVPVAHFTSWDHNWPIGPPPDAVYPNQSRAKEDTIELGQCLGDGSIIECQNQVLRERIPITGTPFTLNYSSARVPDFAAARHIDIPLTDDNNPLSLMRVDLSVSVAGQTHRYAFEPANDLTLPFTWDGMNAFGQPQQGRRNATVRIGYAYAGVYRTGGSGTATFGQPGQEPIIVEGNRTRADFILPQEYSVPIGAWDARGPGLGGWTLSEHHTYDPGNKVLYRGDGTKRSAESIPDIITNVAGTVDENGWDVWCQSWLDPSCGDGLPATEAYLDDPRQVAFAADGTIYLAEAGFRLNRVRRVRPDGIIENFAGTGQTYQNPDENGDGGPALEAKFNSPMSLAVDSEGNVYIGEFRRIRKVDANGIITTYAGGGDIYPPNGAALAVRVDPIDLEVDAQGNLYVTDYCHIFRIDQGGLSGVVAGDYSKCGDNPPIGDGGPAILAGLATEGIDLAPDGSIYVADSGHHRIRRIGPDGIIQTVAGSGVAGFSGDGGPAIYATFDWVDDVDVAADGTILFSDYYNGRVRLVDPNGYIRTIAGYGASGVESGLNGPAAKAWAYGSPARWGTDGYPYLLSRGALYVIKPPFSGLGPGEMLVPSEDGSEIYKFNVSGRHLQTLHALTGAVLYTFAYDPEGRLASVTDGDGKVTTIQRDGSGNPTAILAPFGQVTTLALNANGFLETITNPAAESLQIQSTPGGLITQMTNPRGRIGTYGYDALGRLISQSDNAGQSQTFVRGATPEGFAVTRTTALGRTAHYAVEQAPGTSQNNTNTAPDGAQSATQFHTLTATTSATSATGMTTTVEEGADPRFGMQVPIIKQTSVSVPGGPGFTASWESESELADPHDLFSLVSRTDTTVVAGRSTSSTYTAATRNLVLTSPEGRAATLDIDSQGRILQAQFADLAPLSLSYNTLGQLETVTLGSGMTTRTSTFSYGADGLIASATDPGGSVVSYTRDAVGRLTSKTLPGNINVLFTYNSAGNIESVTPPGQPEHLFGYDLHDRLASVTPPTGSGSGPTTFNYNVDGQLTAISRPGNEGLTIDHDAQGRVTTIELIESDSPTDVYTITHLAGYGVSSIVGPGVQTLSYNYQGDLVIAENWSGIVTGSVSRSYDDALLIASTNVTGGATVNYTWDDDELLLGAGDYLIGRNLTNGLKESASLGITDEAWLHNSFGESTAYTANANASPLFEVSFTRDNRGRITQKVESIDGVTTTYDYGYDVRGQLTEVQANGAVVESYDYDDNGNRLSGTVNGVLSLGTYDDLDRLVSYGAITYTYSPAGRLETRTEPGPHVTTYDYDPIGNLRAVILPVGTTVSYAPDGLHRRVERVVNGGVTQRLIYDGRFPVAVLDAMNNIVAQFVYADGHVPAYMISGGVNYRLITDQIGSVRLVVNATTGTIEQRIDYDAFGVVIADTNPGFQPFGFGGGLYDPLTGLVRFGSRDYDPSAGRWTARDPTGFGAGDTNHYRYVYNAPLQLSDVSGREGVYDDYVEPVWSWYNKTFGDTESGKKSKKIKGPVDKFKKGLNKLEEYLDKALAIKEIYGDPQLNKGQEAQAILQQCKSVAQDIVDFFEKSMPVLGLLDVTPFFESLDGAMSRFGAAGSQANGIDPNGESIDEVGATSNQTSNESSNQTTPWCETQGGGDGLLCGGGLL